MKANIWRAVAPLIVAALAVLPHTGATLPASAHPNVETVRQCPTVTVSCPDTAEDGPETTYTANVSGGDPNVTPTYNWTVSAGTISSGQGTSSIRVETAGVGGQTITATVDVGGFPRECSTSNSCTMSVTRKSAPTFKFAEYVTRDLSANKAELDKFVRALENDPTAQGYIIAYGGRTSHPEDAQKAADNATDYTMNVRKMEGARTLSGVGGYREQPTIEMWMAPAGGTPPMATPTVKPEDVKPAPAKPTPTPRGGKKS